MKSKITDVLPGATAPVLRADLLARLHALNADYLELLATQPAASELSTCLPPRVHAGLVALGPSERRRIARTPYALYSFRFDEVRLWQKICTPAADSLAHRYRAAATSMLDAFRELALIEVWQVAQTDALAARLLYGLPDLVRTMLIAQPLWRIKRIAAEHSRALAPRWPANRRYWPDLIRFAQENDAIGLRTAQLLGTQLIGCELDRASPRRMRSLAL